MDRVLGHACGLAVVLLGLEALLPVALQPTAWVLRGAIRVYQVLVSPLLPSQCKFTPTCSHYGLTGVRRYGTLRGCMLIAWRLVRCSPFGAGGQDPVP